MIDSLPPASILMLGALLVPLARGRARAPFALALTLLSLMHLLHWFGADHGSHLQLELFDYTLTLVRIDRLSLIFGLIFHILAILSVIYSLHVEDPLQHVAGLIYAGAAIAAVFAGDLITLFIYWELTALASVLLIWARRNRRSYRAGMRYLIIQVGSGVLLLAGAVLHARATGSIAFTHLGLQTPGGLLIFLAFGIKCAFPLLHNWLQDSYPEATVTGTVFLSAFTTKLAVYVLVRGYAGTAMLIWIGLAMTLFPIFYAVIENNLRRVLAYSLNNQLGFMVVGIGVGSEMALNGTVAHAFAHLLYKALLFMSMGAVLHRTGTIKATELGGLYRSMPLTSVFCMIGAASISAFPLFSGFVSKSMILTAVADQRLLLVSLGLLVASAGVMEHSGIKIPYFAFFGHDSGIRCKEAPWNMLLAMGFAAALCLLIGIYPEPLYRLLPYAVEYEPYTTTHVMSQLQLLLFAALAFCVLIRGGIYPAEVPSVNLDSDWTYRRLLPAMGGRIARIAGGLGAQVEAQVTSRVEQAISRIYRIHGPDSVLARTWATSTSVLWILVLLLVVLLLYYV